MKSMYVISRKSAVCLHKKKKAVCMLSLFLLRVLFVKLSQLSIMVIVSRRNIQTKYEVGQFIEDLVDTH